MASQSKFILKGLLRAILLIAAIGAIYYGMNMKNKPEEKQPEILSYDELMNTPQIANGKLLFEKHCIACHKFMTHDDTLMDNIVDSAYDKKTLYAWIINGDSVVKSGNVYFNNLYNAFNKIKIPSFPELSDKELDEIIYYIKAEKIYQRLPKR